MITITHLLYVLAGALVLGAAGLIIWAHEPRQESADLESDLDMEDPTGDQDATMRDLREEDLGPLVVGADPRLAADAPAVLDADPGVGRPVDRGPATRLTPAQRRRAVHKGRLPRNLPGPAHTQVGSPPAVMGQGDQFRAGEFHERVPSLTEATTQARAWLAHSEYQQTWAELERLRREAWDWYNTPGRWEIAA